MYPIRKKYLPGVAYRQTPVGRYYKRARCYLRENIWPLLFNWPANSFRQTTRSVERHCSTDIET